MERRRGAHRDVAARLERAAGPYRRAGPGRRVRRARGAAHRSVMQVPVRRRAGRTGRGGYAAHALVDRSRRRLRAVPFNEMTDQATLAQRWRAGRPKVAGLHLDSAACSRQSFAVIDAATQHTMHEAEVGGYVAAEAAAPVLDAGRAAVGALTGLSGSDVVFTTGSNNALDVLLSSWPGERTVACLPGEYGPNLAVMAVNGFQVSALPADGDAAGPLPDSPPALVPLPPLPSHRGLPQPLAELAGVCRDLGVPLVVDAAQALGHLDCAVGADAIYSSSRKWMAGPRGVGVLAIRQELAQRLRPRLPPPEWGLGIPVMQTLELGEANIAARVGYSVALGEHLAAGPGQIRDRLAQLGQMTRLALADGQGWRAAAAAPD